MSLCFPDIAQFAIKEALNRLARIGSRGTRADRGGLPHEFIPIAGLGKNKWHCSMSACATIERKTT
jgi:hypothetical protein